MATKYLDYTGLQRLVSNTKTLVNAKQDTLVSGTNIKTINSQSLLGSGNISISGAVYKHKIFIETQFYYINFVIYSASATAYTYATLPTDICSACYIDDLDDQTTLIAICVNKNTFYKQTTTGVTLISLSSGDIGVFSDTVTQV